MEQEKTKTIVTRLPAPLAAQLQHLAKDEMLPIAAVLRRLVACAVNGRRVAA